MSNTTQHPFVNLINKMTGGKDLKVVGSWPEGEGQITFDWTFTPPGYTQRVSGQTSFLEWEASPASVFHALCMEGSQKALHLIVNED